MEFDNGCPAYIDLCCAKINAVTKLLVMSARSGEGQIDHDWMAAVCSLEPFLRSRDRLR